MVIRTLLVGTSVGLATPAFVIAGVFQAWMRVMPRSELGSAVKAVTGVLIGGGSLTLVYKYIGPFLKDHSELILPFAVSNAIASGFWYTAGELSLGFDAMMATGVMSTASANLAGALFSERLLAVAARLPFAGTMVGVLTAVTAPLLWPGMIDLCWADSLRQLILGERELTKKTPMNSNWLVDTYWHYGLPVALPVGAFAGATMHLVLKPAVVGTPGVVWTARALPSLAAVTLASSLYFTYFRAAEADWWWETRVDHISGDHFSYNHQTQQALQDGGRAASVAALKRDIFRKIHAFRKFCDGIAAKFENTMEGSSTDSGARGAGPDWFPFKPRCILDAPLTLQVVEERYVLFALLDMLVQLKYLDLELAKSHQDRAVLDDCHEERRQLMRKARETGIAQDLSKVLKACELGIVLERKIKGEGMSRADKEKVARRMADVAYAVEREEVTRGGISAFYFDMNDAHGASRKYRLALMSKNMSVLEAEFKSKLGYEPDTSKADTQHLALVASNVMNSGFFKITIAAAGGLLATLLLNRA